MAVFQRLSYEAKPGAVLIAVDGVGKYLVCRGSDITIERETNVSFDQLRVYLMGSAFGALLQQRGMMPLHASAVRVGDLCVAFTGESGAGKSTLAAFCRDRGYEVIGDDLCPMAIDPARGVVVWPGFARIKVWIDALGALGVSPEGLPRVVNKCDKFELPTSEQPGNSVPLRRLYILQTEKNQSPGSATIERLGDSESLESLLNNTYRYEFLKGLGLMERHFHTCVDALGSLSVCRLSQPWDLTRLNQTLDVLEQDWKELHAEKSVAVYGFHRSFIRALPSRSGPSNEGQN